MPSAPPAPFYFTGGTLPAGALSYVERRADHQLLDGLSHGEFCYILTSRQMGKSSIMVRTTQRLRALGAIVVVLDLTAIGQNLTPEQWYNGLANRLARQLDIEDHLEAWWRDNAQLGPCQRFFSALTELALPRLPSRPAGSPPARLVIFIDELDATRSLPFRTDEFFAAIRECFTRRLQEPALEQLTFCLLGVATPSELIQDVHTTPFNIGRRIELRDFSPAEARGLIPGLESLFPTLPAETRTSLARALLDRILYWTNGHPYLTQRLCRAVAERFAPRPPTDTTGQDAALISSVADLSGAPPSQPAECERHIDILCQRILLAERAREKDDNLHYVRDRMLRAGVDRNELLDLYQRVRRGQNIPDDESSPLVNILLLAGIARIEKGYLTVRNRVYLEVFDDPWIRAHRAGPPREDKAVAVLPFTLRGGTTDDEYLSDGMSEDLISALARIGGLKVAARTSSFAFKNRSGDVRDIASQLGVTHVIEGSVRRAGNQLRISAQLIEAASGSPVWSEHYDREWNDVFTVQDEIIRAIVQALKVRLLGETDFALRARRSTEAYQAYLRGRHALHRGSAPGLAEAARHLRQAIELDSEFAPAWATLAETRLHQYFWNVLPKDEALAEARTAAQKALDLDEHLPEAHTALALVRGIIDWDWDGEERHLRRAIELNPNEPNAYAYMSILEAMRRRFDDAIRTAHQALTLDPLSPFVHHHAAAVLYFARKLPEAEVAIRRTLELEPGFFRSQVLLCQLCQDTGRHEEALRIGRDALAAGRHPAVLTALATACAHAGRPDEARTILAELHSLSTPRAVSPTLIARIHAALGERAPALDCLEKAFLERSGDLDLIHLHPAFASLHQESRFRSLVSRLGLTLPPADPAPELQPPSPRPTHIPPNPTPHTPDPTPQPTKHTGLLIAVAIGIAILVGLYLQQALRDVLDSFAR